ncbi:MAG: aminotransferase class I/II-fold pyridoxal phosphate-dependent enzyme, partial [Gemmatimonadales bacterium]
AFYLFPNIAGVCESLGAVEAHARLPAPDRDRTSPSTLFQMFLLWKHHVATLDRGSFGRIGAGGQHYLRISSATGLDELRAAVEIIRKAAADRDGFRSFVQRGEHFS